MSSDCPRLLIVGAGPVGLLLGNLLGSHGIRTRSFTSAFAVHHRLAQRWFRRLLRLLLLPPLCHAHSPYIAILTLPDTLPHPESLR